PGPKLRSWLGIDDAVDMCSGVYEVSGVAADITFGILGLFAGNEGSLGRALEEEAAERGVGAGGGSTIRVGRWMSEAEHEATVASGRVQESTLNGVTSVSSPPDPSAWVRQTTGTRYVEFDVPS